VERDDDAFYLFLQKQKIAQQQLPARAWGIMVKDKRAGARAPAAAAASTQSMTVISTLVHRELQILFLQIVKVEHLPGTGPRRTQARSCFWSEPRRTFCSACTSTSCP